MAALGKGIEDSELALKTAAADWDKAVSLRTGHRLELAFALSLASALGDFSDIAMERAGAWLTYLYNPPSTALDFLACARWIMRSEGGGFVSALDFGARLVYRLEPLAFSIEGLGRSPNGRDYSFRAALDAKVAISDLGTLEAAGGWDFPDSGTTGLGKPFLTFSVSTGAAQKLLNIATAAGGP